MYKRQAYEIEHVIPQSRYFDDSFSNKVICESEVNKLKDNMLGYEFIKKHAGEIVELGFGKSVKIFSVEAYERFVGENYYKAGSKKSKLLMDDIPEKFIERQLNDSRYISRVVKGLLSNVVREEDANGEYESEDVYKRQDSLDRYSLTSASVSPHWVVAYNWQQTIMVFERATGKLRYRFNHQGQQKEQYYYIFSVFVDEEREEIYVVGSVFKIQVYSLSGNYKRTLNLPYDMSFEQVFDYDKDSLIFNDGREDVDNPVQKGTYYYLMSKTDGGMRPLPFHVKYRITNRFRIRLRNGDRQGVISCMFSVKPLLKNGDERCV